MATRVTRLQRTSKAVDRIEWSLAQEEVTEKTFAQGAAAFIAAGIGISTFALLVVLATASAPFAKTITYLKAVGPLSGKAIIAVAVWLVSWIFLAVIMRGRNPGVKTALTVSGLLIAVGFVGTFPLFYDLFKP